MAKKKTTQKLAPINWLRDWAEFDFSGVGTAEIALRQARTEQVVVEFLSEQNTHTPDSHKWHFIRREYWDISGTKYRYIVYLTPPVKPGIGGTVDPPAPPQPPPPNLS